MTYWLQVTPEAEQDIVRIISSYSSATRREQALQATFAALRRLAANPALAAGLILDRPVFHFSFTADDVRHHWAATFKIDGPNLIITQVFRPPM